MPERPPSEGPNELAPTGEHEAGTLGRYRILNELGRGGCGIVYRAMDPSIGRVVAIKTILAKTESPAGQELRERFRREARSAGGLSHPNIVTVHDFSDSGDPMFIAMELVEGRTLAEFMSDGPLTTDFVLGVLRSAADALDYAHTRRIVHRDVKPANFLIDKSGRLKITDFGIAKMLDSEEGLTSAGMVVGTAQYMSPEQISETPLTGRSDQFSLAVIAYEMLTGTKPFQGNSWASVIHAIIMAEPPPVSQYRDTLSEIVNTVLHKALSKAPESRYATCSEFCDALERGMHGVDIERTEIFVKPQNVLPLTPPVAHAKAEVLTAQPAGDGSNTLREVPPTVSKTPALKPLLIGAVGTAVIGAGLWLGSRPRNAPATPPVVVQQPSPASQNTPQNTPQQSPQTPPASQPAPLPQVESAPPPRAAETRLKETAKNLKPIVSAAPPTTTKPPAAPPATTAIVPPSQPIIVPIILFPKNVTPASTPSPVPARAPEDQGKTAAGDQAKRADEQTKRLADDQAKRALDEQTKRSAEEQTRNAHIAENAAISRALRDYQAAYERRDAAGLQAIWPTIPKQILEGIRGSFREASEVSMDLRSLGDPKVAGGVATVMCDRSVHQVILKRVLQASDRVRIVLNRTPAGWVIQSVVPVNQ